MSMFDQFVRTWRKKPATASLAKERLQIVVSHQRLHRNGPDYLPLLQKELLSVIAKYIHVEEDQVQVEIDRTENSAKLALNITLPEIAAVTDR
jgi:cell division topological specificity factor